MCTDVWHEGSCDLQPLPSSIAHLYLCDPGHDGIHSLPAELPQLSGLVQLQLHSCAVPFRLLCTLTALQELDVVECQLLACKQGEGVAQGTAGLQGVAGLPGLTNLQELHMTNVGTADITLEHFTASTASSHLAVLTLQHVGNGRPPLPRGAVQHMFPPGRQMQSLEIVTISSHNCIRQVQPARFVVCGQQ
jgi:hypothetical protein